MPKFSRISKKRLETCDIRLQTIFNEVVKTYDCSILCGYRTKQEQNNAFNKGRSKLKYPHSKHNKYPSKAVDVAPYYKKRGINQADTGGFYLFAGYVKRVAYEMGYSIRQGGDQDSDHETVDNGSLVDLPHFEILD